MSYKLAPPHIPGMDAGIEAIRDHLAGIVGIRYSTRAVELFIADRDRPLPTSRLGRWRVASHEAVVTWARTRWPDIVRVTSDDFGPQVLGLGDKA